MSFFRRIISIFSIAVLIVAIIYGIFWLKTRTMLSHEPGQAIPGDFAICLKINDFDGLEDGIRNRSTVFDELINAGLINFSESIKSVATAIDSLKASKTALAGLLKDEIYFSVYVTDDGPAYLASRKSAEINVTDEFLKNLSNETVIDKRKYENVTYYNIEFPPDNYVRKILFYDINGILVITNSEDIIKKSVRQLDNEEGALRSGIFSSVYETAGSDVPVNLYVNYDELYRMINTLFPGNGVDQVSELFSSSVLDLEADPDRIILNGFSSLKPGGNNYYREYGETGKGYHLLDYLPFNPLLFDMHCGLDLLRGEAQNSDTEQFLEDFKKLVSREGVFFLENSEDKVSAFIMISLISGSNTEELLKEKLKLLSGSTGQLEEEKIRIDNLEFSAYSIEDIPLVEKTVFAGKWNGKFSYFVIYDNILILGETKDALRNILYSKILGTTLNNNRNFTETAANFSSSSNRFIYLNLHEVFKESVLFFTEKTAGKIKRSAEDLNKFNKLAFQSTRSGDLQYFRIFVGHAGGGQEEVNTIWKRKLDTLSVLKPVILVNHNTGGKEIMVQDQKNNLYLISSSGNILWKQQLDSKILGQVYQVDYYKNGKLQYLFNSVNNIYLIDRNGNPVEKFPVKLREKATAGMALFDYDSNGDWRIPIPCADRDIYMYDREGRIVSGWKFRPGDYIIDEPLIHIRIEAKDYIIAKGKFQLYFLDRKGKKRLEPEKQIEFSSNPVYLNRNGNSYSVIATDRKGSVYSFGFDGKVERVFSNELSENHLFLLEDLSGDTKKEFIFIDQETLRVVGKDGHIIFNKEYGERITAPPIVYSFSSNEKKIGVVATKSGKIYLYNKDGSLYKGFPLPGSSLFSISAFPGLEGRFNLIVNNSDNFLYNYSVQ